MLSEELAVREDRRFRTGLRTSKLPHRETLEDFDFSFQPELDPRKVKDLATLSFIEAKANAALLGPPGVGKTHIAVALAVAVCRAGYSIYFTSRDDMVRNLKAAEATGRLTSKLRMQFSRTRLTDAVSPPPHAYSAPGPRRPGR